MTAVQPSLWPELVEPDYAPELTLDERFDLFHAANPHVYAHLRALAMTAAKGRVRISMKMLFEVLRYDQMVQTDGEPWKLNNSFTSRYARLLSEQEPELAGVFETRCLRSQDGA